MTGTDRGRTRSLLGLSLSFGLQLTVGACGTQSPCEALNSPWAVIVTLIDDASGQPICNATVTVVLICDSGASCYPISMTTGPNGQCSYYGGFGPGQYQITVTAPGHVMATQNVDVVASGVCNVPMTQNLSITLKGL